MRTSRTTGPSDVPAETIATIPRGSGTPRATQTQRARAKQSGSGLGLYVAKGLVEAHGGKLAVESTPGVGSVFRVWLPASLSFQG